MKRTTTLSCLVAILAMPMVLAPAADAATIGTRIVMGTGPATNPFDTFPRFFASPSFSQGATSFQNTVSYTDGVAQVDYTLTVSAFDASGNPAGLYAGVGASGVDVGVDDTRIDAGESIVVNYDNIVYSQVGGPSPIGNFATELNKLQFNSFTAGTDTYTYAGPGAPGTGDDTPAYVLNAPVVAGDSFTVTADSGAFRLQWISQQASYSWIPEPTTFALAAFGLLAVATRRRNS